MFTSELTLESVPTREATAIKDKHREVILMFTSKLTLESVPTLAATAIKVSHINLILMFTSEPTLEIILTRAATAIKVSHGEVILINISKFTPESVPMISCVFRVILGLALPKIIACGATVLKASHTHSRLRLKIVTNEVVLYVYACL